MSLWVPGPRHGGTGHCPFSRYCAGHLRSLSGGDDRSTGGAEEIIRGEDRILAGDGHIVIRDGRTSCEVHQVCECLVWYAQQMSQTSQHVVLETLAYLSIVDLTPIPPHVTTPALVMVGERSAMNMPGRTRGLAELLPNGILAEMPGASGYVQHSASAQCVAIWRDFVKGLL